MVKDPLKILAKVKPIFILELLCEDKVAPIIQMVFNAVMVILDEEDTWEHAQRVIGKKDFLDRLAAVKFEDI